MHCLRNVLLYAILIPMPSASPMFLLVFTVAAYWAIKPCGYCMTILAILFCSTSPSSPFLSALSTAPATPPPMAADTLAASYDTNVGNRGAFNLNGGRIFDPLLVGYQEMQRVWAKTLDPTKAGASGTGSSSSSSSAVTRSENVVDGEAEAAPDGTDGDASASASASASVRVRVPDSGSNPNSHSHSNLGWWPGRWPLGMSSVGKRAKTSESRAANADGEQPLAAAAAESPALPLTAPTRASDTRLPAGYVDLRVGGVGLVFDLGWRRTDAALRWEVEDVRYAAEQKRWRGAVREQRRRGGKSVDVGVGVGDAAGGVAEAAVGSEGKKSGWAGASFMGSW